MPRRRRLPALVAASVLLAPAALSAQSHAHSVSADTAARIDAVFARFTRPSAPSPGCALNVVRDGASIYEKGYGYASLELGVPITPRTVFDIGSTSKQFTAASVVLLALDGRLSLDDDVRKYLPELPDLGATVTLRHLLTHTSGWRDYTDLMSLAGWEERDHTTDREAMEPLLEQRALNFAPGTSWRYSNTGFFLAGLVVKRVTGRSLKEFAAERIFQPLAMADTRYLDDTRLVVPRRATGYTPDGEGGWQVEMSDWEQVGDGAVQTSVEDLARWDANFYEPRVGGERLPALLQTRAHLADGTPLAYGLGLFLDEYHGVRRVQHGGAWAGYRAMLMRFPDRHLSVITLCNTADARTEKLADGVADVFLGANEAKAAPAPARSAEVERYAGLYFGRDQGQLVRMQAHDGRLEVMGRALAPTGAGSFHDDATGATWSFAADGSTVTSTVPLYPPDHYERVAPADVTARLPDYVGTYSSDEAGATWRVLLRDGRLFLHSSRGSDLEMRPAFADAFDGPELPVLRFLRDAAGRVTAISLTTRGVNDLRLERR